MLSVDFRIISIPDRINKQYKLGIKFDSHSKTYPPFLFLSLMSTERRYILGIDDTDMPGTRGTGALARQLAILIIDQGLGKVRTITRHQLYRHKDVPFTSQNSSASLDVHSTKAEELFEMAAEFVKQQSPIGADPGIAVAAWDDIHTEIIRWGRMAQYKVLSRNGALAIKSESVIRLEGLGGTQDGIIGALAAIGLRRYGSDGRILWHNDHALREIRGRLSVSEIESRSGATVLQAGSEDAVGPMEMVDTNDWVRPLWSAHAELLYVNKKHDEPNVWKLLTKEELIALGR